MNIFFRASSLRFRSLCLALAMALVSVAPLRAQQQSGKAGNFVFSADHITTPGGSLRIEGNARLYTLEPSTLPQLDISAPLVTADSYVSIRRVRASGGVSFKYSAVRPAATAGEADVPISIQASGQEVLLDSQPDAKNRRTLTLTGSVDGFYQVGKDRTALRGQSAVISFGQKSNDVVATLDGGTQPLELQLPNQSLGPQVSLGKVTLRAQHAVINQATGIYHLEGGARLSSEGPATLQVSAGAFDATFITEKVKERDVRRLSRLASLGRISFLLALPPESVGTPVSGAKDSTYPFSASSAVLSLVPRTQPSPQPSPQPASSAAGKAAQPDTSGTTDAAGQSKKPDSSLVPVRVDVAADSAVIEIEPRPNTQALTQALTLSGNVSGSYVLREVLSASRPARPDSPAQGQPSEGKPGTADGTAEEKVPLTLDLDLRGVRIELPAFNLGLGL